jgi:mRNA-degrading endonuclease RelE of RelBE toxin-antitoxin system
MKSKVIWSEQVEGYVRSKAPDPRKTLWRAIKRLRDWDGKEDPPQLCHLEDELAGYLRLRVGRHRVIFRESFAQGERAIQCLYAGPRVTVYEAFAELFLDELTASKRPPGESHVT